MVIAVASLCLQVDEEERSVRVALGSVAPTVRRARRPPRPLRRRRSRTLVLWDDPDGAVEIRRRSKRFGELVAEAARPIDDVRGTSAYRRHAVAVLARRALAVGARGPAPGVGA